MRTIATPIPDLLIFEPEVFEDHRGEFLEIWREDAYAAAGVSGRFVQDNVSVSRRGVLRGLHFQEPRPQGKLISVLVGAVFDVAVDLRAASPTFRQCFSLEVSDANRLQLYVPEGFAHGFQVISERAIVQYKCTASYEPSGQRSIRWNDPELGIHWPLENPILSDQDRCAPLVSELLGS
jgi:dTDP-4-dehydrorhamnose 3,5-epimerase